MKQPRHLFFGANELAEVATLLKQLFRVRFLKEVRANFTRRNLSRDRQNGREGLVRVKQAIDKMEVARAATASTDGESTRQLRLGAGRERPGFFVAHVNPFDPFVVVNGRDDAVQRISDDAIDPSYPRMHQ